MQFLFDTEPIDSVFAIVSIGVKKSIKHSISLQFIASNFLGNCYSAYTKSIEQ